eukprot:TRINITY_DN12564_c0_g1_i11.p1 TRINITY_DN12564_c0_g1~~TRINITY_DN12564_c0_g1_i11.p1  ORF type:complete len:952 (+),score=145.12 TRINITY_DN12564_c0_g1_i11:64-2919(+)
MAAWYERLSANKPDPESKPSKAVADHYANFTFAPKLNASSLEIAAKHNAVQRAERRLQQRQKVEEVARSGETHRPCLNPRSTALVKSTFFERQQQFLEQRREKAAQEALIRRVTTSAALPGATKPFRRPRAKSLPQAAAQHGQCLQEQPLPSSAPACDKQCACTHASCRHPSHQSRIKTKRIAPISPGRTRALKMARKAREMALQAAADHRVYAVYGRYTDIRNALDARGWVERPTPTEDLASIVAGLTVKKPKTTSAALTQSPVQGNGVDESIDSDDGGSDEDEATPSSSLVARALVDLAPDLIISCKRDDIDYRSAQPTQRLNHFLGNACLTTKVGLSRTIKQLPWTASVHPDNVFPKCFYITDEAELLDFVDDFRLRAAIAILKQDGTWNAPQGVKALALRGVEEYLYLHESGSIETETEAEEDKERHVTDVEWECLLQYIYAQLGCDQADSAAALAVANDPDHDLGSDVSDDDDSERDDDDDDIVLAPREIRNRLGQPRPSVLAREQLMKTVKQLLDPHVRTQASKLLESYRTGNAPSSMSTTDDVQNLLTRLKRVYPQLDAGGFRNIFVIKPAALSRGRGIFCENRLDYILRTTIDGSSKEKWVAQKYIERPLLINNTKFDIRQWVVVTSWNPLTIWMYQDSYLRFSSVPFDLENLHTSSSRDVHLCNNSIQKSAEVRPTDSWAPECMWSSDNFKQYLVDQGQPAAWDEILFPAMCRITKDVLGCASGIIQERKNSFELYGLDFMVDCDMNLWLLEVNASPDMSHSTATTAKLVQAVSEDLIKVVVDRRANKSAPTGKFVLLPKTKAVSQPLLAARDLSVIGHELRRPRRPNVSHTAKLAAPLKASCTAQQQHHRPEPGLHRPLANGNVRKHDSGESIKASIRLSPQVATRRKAIRRSLLAPSSAAPVNALSPRPGSPPAVTTTAQASRIRDSRVLNPSVFCAMGL